MIPNIGLALIENIYGQKLQNFLPDVTGFSDKTWAAGGPKKEKNRTLVEQRAKRFALSKLVKVGYSEDEAIAIQSGASLRTNGVQGIYSTIVDMGSGFGVLPYPKTMLFANRLDRACDTWAALPKHDIAGYADILLANEQINDGWDEWQSEPSVIEAKEALLAGRIEIKHINNLCIYISWREFMSLLACWDVEFCLECFGTSNQRMVPLPLFEYFMPRLRVPPDQWIELHERPPRDWHSLPFRRLLDFLSAVMWLYQHGQWPNKIPNRKDQERYFSSEDNPINMAKVRNGRSKLTVEQFSLLFRNGLWNTGKFASNKLDVLPPFPLYFAAAMWDRFFVRVQDERVTTLFYENEGWYRRLWKYHYDQSEKPGPNVRIEPWPECITQSLSSSD